MTTRYLTWLDGYAAGARDQLQQAGYPGEAENDAEALWLLAMARLAAYPERRAAWDEPDLAQFTFWGAVSAFVAPPRLEQQWRPTLEAHGAARMFLGGRGLKLSPRLVRAFAYARAPATDDWKAMAQERGWYLDLPHHALLLGAREIRAILTHPDASGGVAAVAILTEPGGDELAGRFAWMLLGDTALPTGAADVEIDRAELQRRANDFVALALLYYRSLERTEVLPRQTGPARGTKIARRLARKTHSLFVVHVLPEPAADFDRTGDTVPAGAWKLDHRVPVRGHFRWQPCGPGRERRELRWIAEHVRGADLPEKPGLFALRKPHSRSRP